MSSPTQHPSEKPSKSRFTLQKYQREVGEWAEHNYPFAPASQPILQMISELGDLSLHHMAQELGIRGDVLQKRSRVERAMGRLITHMAHYCNIRGMELSKLVEANWQAQQTERRGL